MRLVSTLLLIPVCLVLTMAVQVAAQQSARESVSSVLQDDLKYIPNNVLAYAVLRPGQMVALEGIDVIPGADFAGAIPVGHDKIERVVAAVIPDPQGDFPAVGVAIQFTEDVPEERVVRWLAPQAEKAEGDFTHYFPMEGEGLELLFADSRTVLAAPVGGTVFNMFFADETPGQTPLSALSARLDQDAQLYGAADVRQLVLISLANLVSMTIDEPDEVVDFPEWMAAVDGVGLSSLSLNLARADGLQLQLLDPNQGVTASFEDLGNSLKQSWNREAEGKLTQLPKAASNQVAKVRETVFDVLTSLQIERSDDSLLVKSSQLPSPGEFVGLVRNVMGVSLSIVQQMQAAQETRAALMHIGLALHNYHDQHGELPRDILDDDGKPLLSWRVHLLPYLGEKALFDQLRLDEAWDSPVNKQLEWKVPSAFRSRATPVFTKVTHFQKPIGPGTVASEGVAKFDDIADGLANTIAVVEAAKGVPWTQPADLAIDSEGPLENLRDDASFTLMYDASVGMVSKKIDPPAFLAALGGADGLPIDQQALGLQSSGVITPPRLQNPYPPEKIQSLMAELSAARGTDRIFATARLGAAGRIYPQRERLAVVDLLYDELQSPDSRMRLAAVLALNEWTVGVQLDSKRLIALADDAAPQIRWHAIRLLADTAEAEVLGTLLALPPEDSQVFLNYGLRRFDEERPPHLEPKLADVAASLIEDPNEIVRRNAGMVLTEVGVQRHRVALEKLQDDPDEYCRSIAEFGLANTLLPKGPLVREIESSGSSVQAAVLVVAESGWPEDEPITHLVCSEDRYDRAYPDRLGEGDFKLIGTLTSLEDLNLMGTRIDDAGLKHLVNLKSLKRLNVSHCDWISPDGFAMLAEFPELEVLDVSYTNFGDAGAEAVGQLTKLQNLDTTQTKLTSRGLRQLSGLRELTRLSIGRTLVTDAGMQGLKGLPKLREFYASGTAISDKSIPVLSTFKALYRKNLQFTAVTDDGLEQLRAALPELTN